MACCAFFRFPEFQAGNDILRQRSGQIGLRHRQTWVKLRGFLEVTDRLFVAGALVCFHSLVQLVTGLQAVAPAHGKHHAGQSNRERRNSCGSIHVLILLLQACLSIARLGIIALAAGGSSETRMAKLYSCCP